MSAEDLMARIEQARSGLQTSRGLLSDARGLCRPGQIGCTQVEGVLESIGRHTGDFFNGASDVVEETVSDLWNTITNPVEAIQDTVYAIQNPGEVWEAVKEPYQEAWNEGRPFEAIGRGVFEGGPVFLGGAGAVRSAAGAARRSRGNNRPSSNDGADGDHELDKDDGNDGSDNDLNDNGADANHTQPSGQEGDVPTGNPTRIDPNDKDPDNIRALTTENESAVTLAREGYKVEQNPVVEGSKNPDYKIEGRIFDCYAPSTSNARNIASHIEEFKVKSDQADRIVLNLDDSGVELNHLRNQLNNYPIQGLKEIIVLKNGEITPFFP
jgi:hypothetical protein